MTTDEALAALDAEMVLWPGIWHVEGIHATASWGTYGPDNVHEPGKGAYRQSYRDSWVVEAAADGWDNERERYLAGGKTIAEAALKVRDHMQHRREDPHYAHIEDHWVVADCAGCAEDVVRLHLEGVPLPVEV